MKKILSVLLVLCSIGVFAQKTLKELVANADGISQHFTRLQPADQVNFSPGQIRALLHLPATTELPLLQTEKDRQGILHYRYTQTFEHFAIENAMYIAHVKNGKLLALSGEIITDFDVEIATRKRVNLTVRDAIKQAIAAVNAVTYAWQEPEMEQSLKQQTQNPKATYYPSATLVWYGGNDRLNSRALQLAYKVDVYARIPLSRAFYFIDASTGQLLGKKDELYYSDYTGIAKTAYSGDQQIHSNLNGSNYQLRDLTKGNGVLTLHGESGKRGTNYTSASANWQLPGTDQAALDAHFGVSATYTYYKDNFSRNSYDNLGTTLTSYVNDPTYTDNAFWDGTTMNFNKRSNSTANPGGVTGIDVTGHELTHGVTQSTSNLNYSKEPGAINESMSDIHGKSVQFYTKPYDVSWVMSNDMNWIIRDMQNPKSKGQPDTYKGINWSTASTDNYGVHKNSGVGNKMFYLLVAGGNGTNDLGNFYDVTGVGLAIADQIIYRTNVYYLTPTSQYIDWRQACINAALDLYPGQPDVLAAVQNAWYAVGVGEAANGSTCETPYNLTAAAISTTAATLNWAGAGVTYNLQWKTSAATTWNTVSGISSTSYNLTNLAANTLYNFKVAAVCAAATSSYSAVANFTTQSSGAITYCTSSGTANYEYIKKVVLGSINNQSNNNNGYGDFTNLSTTLSSGGTYSIALTAGYSSTKYNEAWTVYIDYNHDGDFADAGEIVATGSGKGAITKSFKVPASVVNGATRMRIQMIYGTASLNNPCASYNYGEVEDYSVVLSGGAALNDLFVNQAEKASIKLSPNPMADGGALVVYSLPVTGNVVVTVFDVSGKLIQAYAAGTKQAGTASFRLTRSDNLRPGIYQVVITQNNKFISRATLMVGK